MLHEKSFDRVFLMVSPISLDTRSCVRDGNADAIFFGALIDEMFPAKEWDGCSKPENDALEDEYRISKLADSIYRHLKVENSAGTAEFSVPVLDEGAPSSFLFEQLSVPDLRVATQVRTVSGYLQSIHEN